MINATYEKAISVPIFTIDEGLIKEKGNEHTHTYLIAFPKLIRYFQGKTHKLQLHHIILEIIHTL